MTTEDKKERAELPKEQRQIIGKRIEACRKELKISQVDFLEKVGMSAASTPTYRKIKDGEQAPSLAVLCKMAEVFGCDTAYLLGEITTKRHETEDICKATGLSSEAVLHIQEYTKRPEWKESLEILLASEVYFPAILARLGKFRKAVQALPRANERRRLAYNFAPDVYAWEEKGITCKNVTGDFREAESEMFSLKNDKSRLQYQLDTNFRRILQDIKGILPDDSEEGKEIEVKESQLAEVWNLLLKEATQNGKR